MSLVRHAEAIRRKARGLMSPPPTKAPHTMAEWQLIESAPKDGQILGFMPNRVAMGRPYIAVIWWDDEFRSEGWDEELDDVSYVAGWTAGRVHSFSYEEYAEEHPTHWQPLPEPPTTEGDKR